jgi:hypothetical protein
LEIFELSKMTTIRPDLPPLDKWRADDILEPNRPLWGLPTIAKAIGVSVDKARELAQNPSVPITRPEGSRTYFAYLSELRGWLRGQSGNENP